MYVEPLGADAAEASVLEGCGSAWERLHQRIAHRFGRVEVRARMRHYLAGLLARVQRKNGWQLAEAIGEVGPQGVQRLLRTARWDADKVRDDLRAYVVEHLGDSRSGVLIIDETSFPKKGTHSVGVTPQYCGTLGQTANAQVGVFLAYRSRHGTAFIDRALYLPRVWTEDRERCSAAGVPSEVGFATKVALAKQVLEHAFTSAVPARWVVADSLYGRAHHFRQWLQRQGRAHIVGILPTQVVVDQGRRQRAKAVATTLPAEAWVPRSAGLGSQGERVHAWACVALTEEAPLGMGHWLLVRRALDGLDDDAYYRAYGPVETQADELVRVAGVRWSIEEGFAQAKGEVGLDHYEVRRWDGWYRHITLCLLAHAYLVVVTTRARDATEAEQQKKRAKALLADRVDSAGGAETCAGSGGRGRAAGFPAWLVALAARASSHSQSLSLRPSSSRASGAVPTARWSSGGKPRPDGRGMDTALASPSAAATGGWPASTRPPHHSQRHPVGVTHRLALARDAGRVWQVGDGVCALPFVASGRSLAASD